VSSPGNQNSLCLICSRVKRAKSCLIQDEPGTGVCFSYKMSLGERHRSCWELIVKLQAGESMSLEQIQGFLESSDEVEFKAGNEKDLYEWVNQALQQLNYRKLKRSGRGLVRRYIAKMTGLSRAQATPLLGMYLRGEKVQPKPYRRSRFAERYTRADAELLATVDEAHDSISGPATRKIRNGRATTSKTRNTRGWRSCR